MNIKHKTHKFFLLHKFTECHFSAIYIYIMKIIPTWPRTNLRRFYHMKPR